MIHIASVTLLDFAECFHATASLVAVGSRRNLFWLAVKITVFLGVVAWHSQVRPGFGAPPTPLGPPALGRLAAATFFPTGFLAAIDFFFMFLFLMFLQSSTEVRECLRVSGMWEPFPFRLS